MSCRYLPCYGYAVRPFDSAGRQATFLVERPDGRKWYVNHATVRLLEILEACDELEEVARLASAAWDTEVPTANLREYLDRVLVPSGLVRAPDAAEYGRESAPPARAAGPRAAVMSYRVSLVPSHWVAVLSRPLEALFQPPLVWMYTGIAAVASFWVIFQGTGAEDSLLRQAVAPEVLMLVLMSTFVHELGHAAACSRYGCRHGDLGFGIYLIFPVLFMEVDETWRLSRGQRIVVDLGGVYFQVLFAVLLLSAGTVWPELRPVAHATYLVILVMVAATLNPFFRFDGYWVVSDWLGIPNLRRKSSQLLRRAWAAVRGRKGGEEAPLFAGEITSATMFLAALYTGFCVLFMGYFAFRLLAAYPTFLLDEYPILVVESAAMGMEAVQGFRLVSAFASALGAGMGTLLVVGIPFLAWRVGRTTFLRIGSRMMRFEGGSSSPT